MFKDVKGQVDASMTSRCREGAIWQRKTTDTIEGYTLWWVVTVYVDDLPSPVVPSMISLMMSSACLL